MKRILYAKISKNMKKLSIAILLVFIAVFVSALASNDVRIEIARFFFPAGAVPSITVSHETYLSGYGKTTSIIADASPGVETMQIFLDGKNVMTCQLSECGYETNNLQDGSHVYYATATDRFGNQVKTDQKLLNPEQSDLVSRIAGKII